MKIKDYQTIFINALQPIYDEEEVASFFYLILEHLRGLKRVDLVLQPDLFLSDEEILVWKGFLKNLKNEIPIQHLLGTTSFCGLDFQVNGNVLIPRPETEELVDWIVKTAPKDKEIKIIDIGTGSGCIAISLAKMLPNAKVFAIDVSEYALAMAQKNALNNNVSVTFLHQNILKTEDLKQIFDIIVSNPPYVRNSEKKEIKHNVLAHEPHLALFVSDQDPLVFYKKITQLAHHNLAKKGQLFFEINQYLGLEMQELLQGMNFTSVELRKDIYNNDRMMRAII